MTDPTGGPDLGMMGADRLINQVRQRLADGRRMPTVPRNVEGLDLGKSTKVAKDFEAVFTTQMISQMFKDVPIGMFGGGFGEKIWREHLYNEFGKTLAESGPLGVGEQVLRQILQMQGKQQPEIDALIKQALPNPLTSAAAHRQQIGPDDAAETAAGGAALNLAPGQTRGDTVRERAGGRAVARAVDPTPTMAGIEAERLGVGPKPRDALYDKTPDGRAIPPIDATPADATPADATPADATPADAAAADATPMAAAITLATAAPDRPGAVVHTPLPVTVATRPDASTRSDATARASGAPVALFPATGAGGAEASVGRSLLAAMTGGNRAAAVRPPPTAKTDADGPPVMLLPERPTAITDLPARTAAGAGPPSEWRSG